MASDTVMKSSLDRTGSPNCAELNRDEMRRDEFRPTRDIDVLSLRINRFALLMYM